MKTFIIIYMLIQLTSVASAEIYRWEDANGINFTDNPYSVPEEYREKIFEETSAQSDGTASQKKSGMVKQKKPVITHTYQTSIYQAQFEQQRRAPMAIKRYQAKAIASRAEIEKDTFPSLATLVVIWIIIAFFLITAWVFTIVDIVRSNFITPTLKKIWVFLVVFIPVVGMLAYFKLGFSQKLESTVDSL